MTAGNGQHPPVEPRPPLHLIEQHRGGCRWECLACTAKGKRPTLAAAYTAGMAHVTEAHP